MNKCISYKCLNKNNFPDNPYDQFGPNYCCTLIKPYCCNYYCNCCPVPPGMMQPMPPLPPPVPPPPPGRIVIGEGIFSGIPRGSRGDGTITVLFNTDAIVGGGIVHNDGDSEIMLIPNTMYEYFYSIEIIQLRDVPVSESFLTLSNVPVAGSRDIKNNTLLGPVFFMNSGTFTTDNSPNPILQLEVVNSLNSVFNLRNAVLMLQALQ